MKLWLSLLLAVVALSVFAAAPALAAKAEGKVSGTFRVAWGQMSQTAPGNDKDIDDLESFGGALENNFFVKGSNGPLSMYFRIRFRGRDHAFQRKGAFAGSPINVTRGGVAWAISDAFTLKFGKHGGSPHAGFTENDPVQLFPIPGFENGGTDNMSLEAIFKTGAHEVGIYVISGAPINHSNDGTPIGAGMGGNNNGDNNQLGIIPWYFGKFGAFEIGVRAASSSADIFDPATPGKKGTDEGKASGVSTSFKIKFGGGSIAVDIGQITNDLLTGSTDSSGAAVSEEDITITGVLVSIAGLNAGIHIGESEVGGDTNTKTIISAHYRIPMGDGGWVGPEFQQQTVESARTPQPANYDDEVSTAIRWIMSLSY